MCSVSKPKIVAAPEPEETTKEADEKSVKARDDAKEKAKQMLGRNASILNGAGGLEDKATTKKKSLLGE